MGYFEGVAATGQSGSICGRRGMGGGAGRFSSARDGRQMGNAGRDGENDVSPSERRSPAVRLCRRLLVHLLAALTPALLGRGVGLGAPLARSVPVQYLLLTTLVLVVLGCAWLRRGRARAINHLVATLVVLRVVATILGGGVQRPFRGRARPHRPRRPCRR